MKKTLRLQTVLTEPERQGAYRIFFGTLVSADRLRIINLLRDKDRNVGEIVSALRLDQSVVSHHLARLKRCGFVGSRVDGKYRIYTLRHDTIQPIMELIDQHMSHFCVHILRGDGSCEEN